MSVLKHTPIEQITLDVEELRASFLSGKTRCVEYRRKQLQQLYYLIQDNETQFIDAINADLGRPAMESDFGEIISIKNEIIDAVKNLHNWAKPERVFGGLAFALHNTSVRKDPKGTVLVLGAWNYPITVQIGPIVGAIAAGNTLLLKPSELSEHSAQLIAELWPQYMDPATSRIVNGGISQATELLEQRFEHIFFTGGGRVGRIVAEKAAKWLCPVTLELGGKSPVIVDASSDISIAAHRILWAKAFNTGQTCIAPDYVIVERNVQDKFIEELLHAYRSFWTSMDKDQTDFGRIVSENHWKRLVGLLESSHATVITGGAEQADKDTRFIPLTILKDVTEEDSVMNDELFGPILPILSVESVREAVAFINSREQPLALYMFTSSNAIRDYILTYTRSGGAIRGDLLLHYAINDLPFGGTGPSGYGSYHGKYGFDCFTHQRAFVDAPSAGILGRLVERIMSLRYPPYTNGKRAFFRYVLSKWVFFGRPQNPTSSSTSIDIPMGRKVRLL